MRFIFLAFISFLAASGGGGGGTYPASVIQNGLQAVYDLRLAGAVGPRTSQCNGVFKVPGVDALPANTTFSGGNVITTGNATFSCWNFTGITGTVIGRGNTSVINYNDSKFAPTVLAPTVNSTQFYGLQCADDGSTPTCNVNYSSFNGQKYQSNSGITGGWSGASYLVETGATMTIDHSLFTGIPYDVGKCTNATLTLTNNYTQAYGWNINGDNDAPQMISCNWIGNDNLWDISDGASTAQAGNFGSPPNSLFFNTIDTPSTQNSTQSFTNNIAYGWGQYGTTCCTNVNPTANGLPFNVLSVCDNHTNTGSGLTLNLTATNNVIQKANNDYTTHGGTITSSACLGTWTTNIDYDTSATITKPSF